MFDQPGDIISQLQKAILPLQGYRSLSAINKLDIGFRPIERAFPGARFPTGAIHEFLNMNAEETAASSGFIGALIGKIMKRPGACLWIGSSQNIFPPALQLFDIDPHRIIFANLEKERNILWAIEEALKCERLTAVVGEIRDINLTASRRLQLAVEQSKVTGFILRNQPSVLNPLACVARWKISPLASELDDEMPGVGFPRWNVELLRVRNGSPGIWQVEWSAGRFSSILRDNIISMPAHEMLRAV